MNETLTIENGLTLKHYKEPLRKVKKGFGYQGALLSTPDGEKVQCHMCGGLYQSLPMHIFNTHELRANDYREKFGLARTTALISENFRERLKIRTLEWLGRLSKQQKEAHLKKSGIRFQAWLKENPHYWKKFKIRLETKNVRGSCPDQIKAKIVECYTSLGHTPSKGEFLDYCGTQRYIHLAYATFGSWSKAVAAAKLSPKIAKRSGGLRNYSNDELLEALTVLYQETGRIPTESDYRRGLIPSPEVYRRRWGSMAKARLAAGIQEFPKGRWSNK